LRVNTRFVASREVHRNLIQARRADTGTAGGDSHRWDRMELLSFFLPGACRPRQRWCRPSGAGVVGKHPVCCFKRGSSQLGPGPEGRHKNCRWRQPPVVGWNSYPSSSPGPVGPGKVSAAPPGLVLRVNMRCVAATEVARILFQARRADTGTAGGDSHRWERMELLSFFLPGACRPRQRWCRPSGAGVVGKHPVCCFKRGSPQLDPGPEGRHRNCRWRQPPVGYPPSDGLRHQRFPGETLAIPHPRIAIIHRMKWV